MTMTYTELVREFRGLVPPPCSECLYPFNWSATDRLTQFDCPPERLMAVRMTGKKCVTYMVNGGHHTFMRLAE